MVSVLGIDLWWYDNITNDRYEHNEHAYKYYDKFNWFNDNKHNDISTRNSSSAIFLYNDKQR